MSNCYWNSAPKTYSRTRKKALKPVEKQVKDDQMDVELPRNCQDEKYNDRFGALIGQTIDFREAVNVFKEVNSPVKGLSPLTLTSDDNKDEDVVDVSFNSFEDFVDPRKVFNSTPLSHSDIHADEEIKDISIIGSSYGELFTSIPNHANSSEEEEEEQTQSTPSMNGSEESSIVGKIYKIPSSKLRSETPHPEVRLPPLVRQNFNLGLLKNKLDGVMMSIKIKDNVKKTVAEAKRVGSCNAQISPSKCDEGANVVNKGNIFGSKEIKKLKELFKDIEQFSVKKSQELKPQVGSEAFNARQPFSSLPNNKLIMNRLQRDDDDNKIKDSNQCFNNDLKILGHHDELNIEQKPIMKSSICNIIVSQSNKAQTIKSQQKRFTSNILSKPGKKSSTAKVVVSRCDVIVDGRNKMGTVASESDSRSECCQKSIDPVVIDSNNIVAGDGKVENIVAGTSNQNEKFMQTGDNRLPPIDGDCHDNDVVDDDGGDDDGDDDACHTPHLLPQNKKVKVLLRKRRRKATVFQRKKLRKVDGFRASKKRLNFKEINNNFKHMSMQEDDNDAEKDDNDEDKAGGYDNDEDKACDDDNDEDKAGGDDNDEDKACGGDNDFHVEPLTASSSSHHVPLSTKQLTSTLIDSSINKDPQERLHMDISSIRFQADSSILDKRPSTREVNSKDLFDLQSISAPHLSLDNHRQYIASPRCLRDGNADASNNRPVAMLVDVVDVRSPTGDRVDGDLISTINQPVNPVAMVIGDLVSMVSMGDQVNGDNIGDLISMINQPINPVDVVIGDPVDVADDLVSKVDTPILKMVDDPICSVDDPIAVGVDLIVTAGSPVAMVTEEVEQEVVIQDADSFTRVVEPIASDGVEKSFDDDRIASNGNYLQGRIERCCLEDDFDYDWIPSRVDIYRSRTFDPLAVYPQDDLEFL